MKKCKGIIVVAIVMLFLVACKERVDDTSDTQEIEIVTEVTSTVIGELTTEETVMPVTREYFENVNKDYKLKDIEKEIGPCSGYAGSGLLYYVWKLEDGTKAHVLFSEDGKIDRIHIIDADNKNEMIYWRNQKEKNNL